VVNERVNVGSLVLFFGKKLQDSSRQTRMRVHREPEKELEVKLKIKCSSS
jgi:hypothetical protein